MASPFVRHDSQIAVGVESSQGTAVTPSRTFGKLDGDTDMPDPSVDWLEERSISAGASRELTGQEPGRNTYDGGSLPIKPVDGFPIALLLGKDVTTADTGLDSTGTEVAETGTTLHTMTVQDSAPPPTTTIEATYYGRDGGANFVRTFTGATPPSGTISTDNEGVLTTEMDMLAMGVDPNPVGTSPASVSADTRDPWLFHDTESNLSLAGTSYARVQEFEFEITTNVDPRFYIQAASGEDPFEILYGNIEYEITATIVPTDNSLYSDLLGRSNGGSANIQFHRPGSDERLRFEFSNIAFEEAPHSYPEEGTPEVDVTIIPESVTVKVEDTQTTSAYV